MKTLVTNQKYLLFITTLLIACSVRGISYGAGTAGAIIDIGRIVGIIPDPGIGGRWRRWSY